jgi:hypothetical protein
VKATRWAARALSLVAPALISAQAPALAAPKAPGTPEAPEAPKAPGTLKEPETSDVLDAPAPPTLPALAHANLGYTFEYTAAFIEPNDPTSSMAYAWFVHNELEQPLVSRKWYIGLANDVAAASVPGVGRSIVLGNPEIWGRGLWSSALGLSSGGGLGVVLPIPRSLDPYQVEVLRTVRVVRPWDVAYFNDLTLTFRPWLDIRYVTRRLIVQIRQGIDWSVVLGDNPRFCGKPPCTEEGGDRRTDITARLTLYAGYRATRAVGLGLELWEVYQVTADLPDDKRAAFAISPSVRFILPYVQPAISVLFPIATPLRGDVASYYALRLNVGFTFNVGGLADDEHD